MSPFYRDKASGSTRRPLNTPTRAFLILLLAFSVVCSLFSLYLLTDLMGTVFTDPKSPTLPLNKPKHFLFSAPTTYFLPSLSSTNPTIFDPTTTNFGLIHQDYPSDSSYQTSTSSDKSTDWQRFAHHLKILNSQSSPGTSHHVFFLSRHGQGYHNLAESYYGTDAWDCHFAELDGDPDPDSNISWVDASLSRLGRHQAREQARFWKRQYEAEKMPDPKSWWVSPMERACRTAQITHGVGFEKEESSDKRIVTVKEFLRETNGIHTCDMRGKRSEIAKRYPGYTIESGFTEHDELWDPIYRETDEAHTYRAKLVLDDILGGLSREDDAAFLSFTAHGGMINALLRAVGHRQFQVQVGSAIAVYITAEKVDGSRPKETLEKGKTKPACKDDPLKAGLPGYKSLKEYVEKVEASVEGDV